MNLITLHDQGAHLRLLSGRLPTADDIGPTGGRRFEIALAKPTADLLHAGLGTVLNTGPSTTFAGPVPPTQGPRSQAVVVGVFQLTDPNGPFWSPSAAWPRPAWPA